MLRIARSTPTAATGQTLAQSPALPPGVNERFGHTSLRGVGSMTLRRLDSYIFWSRLVEAVSRCPFKRCLNAV